MTQPHKIEVEEITTVTRIVSIAKSEYPDLAEAEKYVAEALNNIPTEDVGIIKSNKTNLTINGFDLNDFDPQ